MKLKRMKQAKNEQEEETSKVLVYHPPFRPKVLHKARIGITKESLNYQRLKKTKPKIWELDTLSISLKNKTLKLLTKEMKFAKTIRKLNLNSRYHHDITDAGLSYLGNSVKGFPTMKELTLDFYYFNEISNEGIKNLCKGIKRVKFLKKAHFDLSTWSPIYSKGFSLVRASLKPLRYLQRICLDFGSNFRKDGILLLSKKKYQGPNRILEGLKRCCRFLENVALIFYRDYLSDVPFEVFSEALGKLTSLRKVSIELEDSTARDFQFLSLCKNLGKIEWIKIIHVNLYGCQKVSDDAIEHAKKLFHEVSLREVVVMKGPERKFEERRKCI